jgi:hypothetical protein
MFYLKHIWDLSPTSGGGGDSVKEENIVFVPFRVGSLSKVWQKKEETAIVSRECSEAITV